MSPAVSSDEVIALDDESEVVRPSEEPQDHRRSLDDEMTIRVKLDGKLEKFFMHKVRFLWDLEDLWDRNFMSSRMINSSKFSNRWRKNCILRSMMSRWFGTISTICVHRIRDERWVWEMW